MITIFNKKILISFLIIILGGFVWFFLGSSVDPNLSPNQETDLDDNTREEDDSLSLDFESIEPITYQQTPPEEDNSINTEKDNNEIEDTSDKENENNNKITVKNPVEENVFSNGSNIDILWNSEGNIENVDIRLREQSFSCSGDSFCESLLQNNIPRYIADDTENDGVYEWKVPEDIIPGKYVIEILNSSRLDGGINESNIFSITNPEEEIDIVFPVSEHEIYTGQNYTIVWSGGQSLFYVDIVIKNTNNNKEVSVVKNLRNENYFVWNVDNSLDPGEYSLIIKGVNDQIKSKEIIIEIK